MKGMVRADWTPSQDRGQRPGSLGRTGTEMGVGSESAGSWGGETGRGGPQVQA